MLDVAIIGAGPVGLATAAAILQRRGVDARVQVFDQAQELLTCGAGLILLANGLAALKAISPMLLAHVCTAGTANGQCVKHTADGNTVTAPLNKPDDSNNTHEASREVAFGWSDLRDALVQWLPTDTVRLGKRFTFLLQHDDHVVVRFADGSRVEAQVVVGADGCFSQVRQQTLNDGPPDAAGTIFWRARLPLQQVPDSPAAEKHMFLDNKASAIFYPISDGHYVWTIATPTQRVADAGLAPKPPKAGSAAGKEHPNPIELDPLGTRPNGITAHSASNGKLCRDKLAEQRKEAGQVILERCKRVWGDGAEMITAAVKATDPATALEHNLYVRHPSSLDGGCWGVGRATLVGDAAHPLCPTGHLCAEQGVNQGLEDAHDLGVFLGQDDLTADSLRRFEASRIPRVQTIMAAEMINGLKSYAISPGAEQQASSLMSYDWARALWEAEGNSVRSFYEAWTLSRRFCLYPGE